MKQKQEMENQREEMEKKEREWPRRDTKLLRLAVRPHFHCVVCMFEGKGKAEGERLFNHLEPRETQK